MSMSTLSNFILLPELNLNAISHRGRFYNEYRCSKARLFEVCPRCANPSDSTYDHRIVRIKDAPIRGTGTVLLIRKRRLWCKPCNKPFTEPITGVRKGKRHTERYATSLAWACENFSDLKRVKRAYRCSSHFVYQAYYTRLKRKVNEQLNYPWPSIIGIDEHAFARNPVTRRTQFASMIVDYNHRRVRELVCGKTTDELLAGLSHINGRENVRVAVLDLCNPFKNFVKLHLPNAQIVADKFHVLRLLSPALLRHRKEITGTRADATAKRLLLMSNVALSISQRSALYHFLAKYPDMHELYAWKERLHGLYRTRGHQRAAKALTAMTDQMAHSKLPEIKTLRRTLVKWRNEILNYFLFRITNGRTEGFNNKAKLVKRRAYGYRSFENYRLKVLTACL